MALLRRFLPFTRITMVMWAWRNRASVLEWATFGLRAAQAAADGKGLDDAKTEFRLRANLARDHRTRHAILEVAVDKGVAHLAGRVSPEVHAVVQDIVAGTRGVTRLDDRITHSLGKGGFLKRRAKVG